MVARTFPARLAAAAQLERLSDRARELGLGQAGNAALWAAANRAVAHVGYAVCADRMVGADVDPGDATIWTIAGDQDVLVVAWWVRMRPDAPLPTPVVPLIITMEPQDYTRLDRTSISPDMVSQAHELAAEFLTAIGVWPPKSAG